MSIEDFLAERRRGLEEAFFAKRNAELLANLKQNLATQEQKQALAAASGISDETVLNHLLDANIHAETIAALGVVPLLAVAWADGQLDDREKQSVLAACEAEGITPGSDCYLLLESWLRQPPSVELLTAWKDFISAAKVKLSPEALSALQDDVLGRATKIADSSGGLLGIHTISAEEQRVLEELKQSFSS
jgi:hypothetical protein